jgi:hypothetical protein
MNIRNIFNGFKSLKMGFPAIGKGNHSHMALLDIPLHVDAVTEESKLP